MTRYLGPCWAARVLKVVRQRLPNGLRVLFLQLPHVHSVAMAVMVRSGPRFEASSDNGLSHLVEHLLFRGTRSHPSSLSFHVAVEALGGEINGLTQRDATTIHLTVPPRATEDGLALLGEVCTEPLLTGLDVERDVVMEEILDSLDSDGNDLDNDNLSRRVLWAGHPMAQPVAGTIAGVERFTEADCVRFFRRAFVAENAVLCLAGPVEPEALMPAISATFSRMPSGVPLPEVGAPHPQIRQPIQIRPTDDSQISVLLTFPAPHENHPDFSTLLLLRRVLDDGFGARLRQAICEQRGLAYSLSVTIDAYGDAGAFDIEISCAPRKLVSAVRHILLTLRTLVTRPPDFEELRRAKTRHVAELEFGLDDASEIAGWYGGCELIGCQMGYEERLSEVMAISPADIRRLAARMLTADQALLTLVGPVRADEVGFLEALLDRPSGSTRWLSEPEVYEDEEDDEDVWEDEVA